jgi:hypothetical protein
MRPAAAAVAAAALSLPAPALAGEAFLGLYAHDVDDRLSIAHSPESGQQVIGGWRSEPVESWGALRRPQVHVLAAVNTAGGVNYAAAGLSWRIHLGEAKRFYVQPGIGVAVHTGKVNLASPFAPGITAEQQQRRLRAYREHLDLGSRVLFEPELSLGWRASERLALELSWIHLSHAQLAGRQNPGLGELGVRAVYRFGG